MKKILLIISVLLLSLSLFAEPYTYDDLLSIMNVNNIELLTQDEVIKNATLDIKDAKANYHPTIDLSLSGTYMVNPLSLSKDDLLDITDQFPELSFDMAPGFSFPINISQIINNSMDDSDKIKVLDPFMYNAQLNLTQPIFTWGKVTNAVKLYEKLLEVRQLEKADKMTSLSVELEGYLGGLYYANEIQNLLSSANEDAAALVNIAQSGYENGVMLLSDYNEARLSKSELDMAITEVEVQISQLEDNIIKTLGSDISMDDIEFTPDENRYYEISQMDRNDLRARAVSSANSNIRMASMGIEAAEIGEDIARGSMYGKPDIALQVGLGYMGFVGNGWEHSGDYSLNVSVGLKTTLWDGGKVLNNIDRAKSQQESAFLTLENAKSELSMTLENSFRTIDLAISRIEYYETKKEVLTDEFNTLNVQKEQGYASESDYLQKKIEIYQNEISIIQEKTNLMQSALTIEYIAGLR